MEKIMDNLTIKQKVDLFKDLYTELAGRGIKGDTELAHVNKYEAAVLRAMGGSGTINPVTELREYWDDDDDAPEAAPTSTTVRQVADLPEFFKPYAEKVLATAEQVYEQPYVPFEDRRLAPVSAAQKTAFTGLENLFSDVDPTTGERVFKSPTAGAFETARQLAGKGAAQFGELEEGVFEEKYMSPYQRAVTDIQIREAERRGEDQRKQLASAAMKSGALGSSRFGVQEALRGEGQQRLLSDIEQQGLQRAFDQGLKTFDADRAAARTGATQYGALGTQEQASGLSGLGALQATGETQRAIGQQPLDLTYEEFVRQQNYPRQSLQELSGLVRGYQVPPDTYKTTQKFEQPASLGQQLLAAGTLGGGIATGLGKSLFGKASMAHGGLLDLAPKRYKEGTEVTALDQLNLIKEFPTITEGLSRAEVNDLFTNMSEEELIWYFQDLDIPRGEIRKFLNMKKKNPIVEFIKGLAPEEIDPKTGLPLDSSFIPTQPPGTLLGDLTKPLSAGKAQRPELHKALETVGLPPESEGVMKRIEPPFDMLKELMKEGQTQEEIQAALVKEQIPGLGTMEVEIEDTDIEDYRKTPTRTVDFPQPIPTSIIDTAGLKEPSIEDYPDPGPGLGVEPPPEEKPPFFDLKAALPLLKMAADFSKPGLGTARAASQALEGYEDITSQRAKGELAAGLTKSQTENYYRLADSYDINANIARAKLVQQMSKDHKDSIATMYKNYLDNLTTQIGDLRDSLTGDNELEIAKRQQEFTKVARLYNELVTLSSAKVSTHPSTSPSTPMAGPRVRKAPDPPTG